MATNTNDGGPAFPNDASAALNAKGMTLRDWFAGQALIAALTGAHAKDEESIGAMFKIIAGLAYQMADAMLAARTPATER